jgi:hypothetical protein
MVSSQTDDGDFLFGAAKRAIEHVAAAGFYWPAMLGKFRCRLRDCSDGPEESLTSNPESERPRGFLQETSSINIHIVPLSICDSFTALPSVLRQAGLVGPLQCTKSVTDLVH